MGSLLMLIDVEVTQRARGRYTARALRFPDLVVEAESRAAALAGLRQAFIARRVGGEIVQIDLEDETGTAVPIWPTHAGAFPDDAAYQQMLAAIEQERRTLDAASG